MNRLSQRIWNSPTLMTWLNFSIRVLSLSAVLPLVLRKFTPGDIALYYLFASVVSLQLLVCSGLVPTFARFLSYALAGANESDLERLSKGNQVEKGERKADPRVITQLIATLHRIFFILSFATIPIMAVVGFLFLRRPIVDASDPTQAWMAWLLVLLVTPLTLYSSQFGALLEGTNRIALEQRWAAIFVLVGVSLSFVVLLCGGGLMLLVAANQFGQVLAFFRLSWLARRVRADLPYDPKGAVYSPPIFRAIWPSAWRSFIGVASSSGITALSGLVFSQRLPAAALAEFLFGLRMMSLVSEVSRAPFYSKLPRFNAMRIKQDFVEFRRTAQKAMRICYGVFISGFLITPVAAAILFPLVKSNVSFPSTSFWCLLGLANLLERFGAMHIQIYSTTNDIIWHWLNGITGIIWIVAMLLLSPWIGSLAFPVGMLLAFAVFYVPVALARSLSSLSVDFWGFERATFIPALLLFLTAIGGLMLLCSQKILST